MYLWTAKRWILFNRSKGHFSRLEGQKNVKLGYFATFWQFAQERSDNFFIQLLGDDIDPLSRDRFN